MSGTPPSGAPAGAPPGGVPMGPPPPVNPDDPGRGPVFMGFMWTFIVIAIAAVALRFSVRMKINGRPAIDDWLMLTAVILNTVNGAMIAVSYSYGYGMHDADMTLDQIVGTLKWGWITQLPGMLTSIIARISIAVMLVRLFGRNKPFKWFMIAMTVFTTMFGIVIVIATWTQVSPVEGNWMPFMPARRWDPRIFLYLSYIGQTLYTITDLAYVIFPVIIIWGLHMPVRARVGLVLLTSTSLITMVLSILKTISFKEIADQQSKPGAPDAVYYLAGSIFYAALEQAFVIIMGCVPPLRSVTKLDFVKSITSSFSSTFSTLKGGKSTQASFPTAKRSNASSSHATESHELGKGPYTTTTAEYRHPKESEERLVDRKVIGVTSETRVTYGNRWDAV